MTTGPIVVGVDLGGTKTSAALVTPDGDVGPVVTLPTPAAEGPDAVLDTVAHSVRSALRASGGPQPLAAVGIGTAGAVDADAGRIVSATSTFRGWVGTDLRAGVRDRLGPVDVAIRNDVDAHALGEAWRGAAASASTFLMVAAGTGIGGAIVIDGRLRTGAHHVAGEMGHMPAPGAEGLTCPCGRTGHLEALAAGPAIHRGYLARGGSPQAADTRAVFALAAAGDGAALAAIEAAATGLGRAVAGIVTTLDPDAVVVGGGLAVAGPLWWRPFEDALRAELIDALADLPVLAAAAGQSAAIIGAAGAVQTGSAPTRTDGRGRAPVARTGGRAIREEEPW